MTEPNKSDTWLREELMHLLSVSGTLAGLCVTVVALMKTLGSSAGTATVVDDMFAVCALLFLTCTYLIFWVLRTRNPGTEKALVQVVDLAFLVALTVMTAAAFVMVYTLW